MTGTSNETALARLLGSDSLRPSVPVFRCFGGGVPIAEGYTALATVTRLAGVHPKLGDFRYSKR